MYRGVRVVKLEAHIFNQHQSRLDMLSGVDPGVNLKEIILRAQRCIVEMVLIQCWTRNKIRNFVINVFLFIYLLLIYL